MDVGIVKKALSNYKCEAESGQPCCILREVMHCDVD
jgi:hypothetical protein